MNQIDITKEKYKVMKQLFMKYRKLIKGHEKLMPFEGSVIILLRNNRKGEFIEWKKGNKFEFKHTDGQYKTITLNVNKFEMEYAKSNFGMYICHEDIPFPIPSDPILYAEEFELAIDKIRKTQADWKAKANKLNAEAIGEIIKWILIAIAVIAGIVIVGNMIAPELMAKIFDKVGIGAKEVIQNVTTTPRIQPINPTIIR